MNTHYQGVPYPGVAHNYCLPYRTLTVLMREILCPSNFEPETVRKTETCYNVLTGQTPRQGVRICLDRLTIPTRHRVDTIILVSHDDIHIHLSSSPLRIELPTPAVSPGWRPAAIHGALTSHATGVTL